MVGNLSLLKCGINSDTALMLLKMDKYRAIITEVQNNCFFSPALKSVNPKIPLLIVSCLKAEKHEELGGFCDCSCHIRKITIEILSIN